MDFLKKKIFFATVSSLGPDNARLTHAGTYDHVHVPPVSLTASRKEPTEQAAGPQGTASGVRRPGLASPGGATAHGPR